MKLQESGENYLETILILKNRFGYVRAIDVANEMGFSKPSVSRAVSILKENGYIASDPNGKLLLTKEGQKPLPKRFTSGIKCSHIFCFLLALTNRLLPKTHAKSSML